MTWPLRLQILLPAACLLVIAVCINAIAAALWASHQSELQITQRLQQVGQVLAETSFPRSPQVLAQLRQLIDAEFAVWDVPRRQLQVSTFSETDENELDAVLEQSKLRQIAGEPITIRLGGQDYQGTRIEPSRTHGLEELWILVPKGAVTAERWTAAWPALIVGGLSLLLMIPIVSHVARRIGQRISTLQRQVAAVADGQYEPLVDVADVDDEIHRLVDGVNEMTSRLRELQQRIAHTERTRLLGQFAGGVAHQLRNAVAGARLAIQLHERRCAHAPRDESLSVALKQLNLTEQHLKGLLALGRKTPINRTECDPAELLHQVVELIAPMADHHGVELTKSIQGTPLPVTMDREAVVSALLNLMINGLEAAGRSGQMRVELEIGTTRRHVLWRIADSGAGPPPELVDHMFEPFQTSKPQGVGLGLAQARQVANDHGGTLDWKREESWTLFELTLPCFEPHTQSHRHVSNSGRR